MTDPKPQPASETPRRRTPGASLREVFLLAAASFPAESGRSEVVGEALEFLQRGFEVHYDGSGVTDDEVLVGDNDYAWAVETIARLDEPPFVAVASRMIRDGAGRISDGGDVTLAFWSPHLAELLTIISGETHRESEKRVVAAAEQAKSRG